MYSISWMAVVVQGTIDPRIPMMPGRRTSGFNDQTSGFQQPGGHCLHQARSAVRYSASRMKGELHPNTKNAACEADLHIDDSFGDGVEGRVGVIFPL